MADTGQGTVFLRNSVELADINSIEGPGKSRETIDVTTLSDTAGYREYIGGLREPGTVTLSMNFNRDSYDLLNEDFESDEVQSYEIQLPDTQNTTFAFDGLVTELPISVPIGDKITCEVTIQISGSVTVSGSSGA